MAIKIIQILITWVAFSATSLYAQSPSRIDQLLNQVEQSSDPFELDGWVKQLEHQWFRQPFDLVAVQQGYEKLSKILKSKHQSLFLKVQGQLEAISNLSEPRTLVDQERAYDILRGNLILMSDHIENREPTETQQKFRTYVLSYILENTSVATQADWPIWKGLARVIGHEPDDMRIVETWIQQNAPHPIALRIFPLVKFHFLETYGTEGPKQKLQDEDAQRLERLKQQVFASST